MLTGRLFHAIEPSLEEFNRLTFLAACAICFAWFLAAVAFCRFAGGFGCTTCAVAAGAHALGAAAAFA